MLGVFILIPSDTAGYFRPCVQSSFSVFRLVPLDKGLVDFIIVIVGEKSGVFEFASLFTHPGQLDDCRRGFV